MQQKSMAKRARALHSGSVVWDAHTCLPLQQGRGMAALERHRAAGVTYVSVNVGMDLNPLSQILHAIASFRAYIREHPSRYLLARDASDVALAKRDGRLAVGFDLEGAAMLGGDLALLQLFHDLGVRQMHLAYNRDNDVAGGCHGDDIPLSALGRRVVEEINRLGLLMDCSHSGYRTSLEVMERSQRPVVFSHSNVKALCPHPRNVSDDQIRACARTGGVVALSGIGLFLGGNDTSTEMLLRHVDHVVDLVGVAHVAIGLDYVFEDLNDDVPPGVDRGYWWPAGHGYDLGQMSMIPPERFPEITEALLSRGYSEADAARIIGGNMTRVATESWAPVPSSS